MRDDEGWSFRNRSFATALAISLLWHFFWFFAITITVTSPKRFGSGKIKPQIVSLGPVLDDKIFRTLVQNKPTFSETFYRRSSDFLSPLDLEVKTIERHSSGEVVSLPFRKKFWSSLKELVGGTKTSPDYAFVPRLQTEVPEEAPGLEGEIGNRPVLNRPEEPVFPLGFDPALKDSETEIQFSVDPAGSVSQAEVLLSSGNPDLDLVWVRYLRQWQFSALSETDKPAGVQTGKIRFRFSRLMGK